MRRPAANLFRFSPDYAQREAGLGAYAYHQLGWRRAAVVADYANPGWAGAAAFTAEFCALGGHVVTTVYAGTQDRVGRALAMQPDGIATFVEYIDPAKILGSLASKLHDPRRLLVSSANLEDPQLMQTIGRRLDGVVGSTWLPSSPPSPVLRDYRRRWRAAFPGLPAAFANHSAVIGYYNALEETVSALGRIRSADVRAGLMDELRRARLDLPGGPVTARQKPASGSRRVPLADRPPWRKALARAGQGRAARRAELRGPALHCSAARSRLPAVREGNAACLGAVADASAGDRPGEPRLAPPRCETARADAATDEHGRRRRLGGERRAGASQPFAAPAVRQADDDRGGAAGGVHERGGVWLDENGLGRTRRARAARRSKRWPEVGWRPVRRRRCLRPRAGASLYERERARRRARRRPSRARRPQTARGLALLEEARHRPRRPRRRARDRAARAPARPRGGRPVRRPGEGRRRARVRAVPCPRLGRST